MKGIKTNPSCDFCYNLEKPVNSAFGNCIHLDCTSDNDFKWFAPLPDKVVKMTKGDITAEEKDRLFHVVADEIASIICAKTHDYGDSFYGIFKECGDTYPYVRIREKLDRLKTLLSGVTMDIKDESIDDSYADIAGYCILRLASKVRLQKEE